MSGWAQREAERQEDDEQEIDLSYERFKKEALQDPETRKEYDRLNNNPLTWQDQPTEDGYYWLRHDKNDHDPEVVYVTFRFPGNKSITFCGVNEPGFVDTEPGEWYGPITPPKED